MAAAMPLTTLPHTKQQLLRPPTAPRTLTLKCPAASKQQPTQQPKEAVKVAAATTVAATLLSSGNALAAQEFTQLAAGDNRLGAVLFLLVPALGWVLFNIGGPASRQLDGMSNKGKGVAVSLGLGAAGALAMSAQQAEAADQVAQLAAGDNRLGAVLFLIVPALGWVLFNIGGPASRQLDEMNKK